MGIGLMMQVMKLVGIIGEGDEAHEVVMRSGYKPPKGHVEEGRWVEDKPATELVVDNPLPKD